MLKRLFNFIKNKEAVMDAANVALGLLMLTALVVFWKTGSRISMFAVIFFGALMNLSNGYRYLKQKGKRQMGYSMILLGVVILVMGVVILLV